MYVDDSRGNDILPISSPASSSSSCWQREMKSLINLLAWSRHTAPSTTSLLLPSMVMMTLRMIRVYLNPYKKLRMITNNWHSDDIAGNSWHHWIVDAGRLYFEQIVGSQSPSKSTRCTLVRVTWQSAAKLKDKPVDKYILPFLLLFSQSIPGAKADTYVDSIDCSFLTTAIVSWVQKGVLILPEIQPSFADLEHFCYFPRSRSCKQLVIHGSSAVLFICRGWISELKRS